MSPTPRPHIIRFSHFRAQHATLCLHKALQRTSRHQQAQESQGAGKAQQVYRVRNCRVRDPRANARALAAHRAACFSLRARGAYRARLSFARDRYVRGAHIFTHPSSRPPLAAALPGIGYGGTAESTTKGGIAASSVFFAFTEYYDDHTRKIIKHAAAQNVPPELVEEGYNDEGPCYLSPGFNINEDDDGGDDDDDTPAPSSSAKAGSGGFTAPILGAAPAASNNATANVLLSRLSINEQLQLPDSPLHTRLFWTQFAYYIVFTHEKYGGEAFEISTAQLYFRRVFNICSNYYENLGPSDGKQFFSDALSQKSRTWFARIPDKMTRLDRQRKKYCGGKRPAHARIGMHTHVTAMVEGYWQSNLLEGIRRACCISLDAISMGRSNEIFQVQLSELYWEHSLNVSAITWSQEKTDKEKPVVMIPSNLRPELDWYFNLGAYLF